MQFIDFALVAMRRYRWPARLSLKSMYHFGLFPVTGLSFSELHLAYATFKTWVWTGARPADGSLLYSEYQVEKSICLVAGAA